MTNLVQYRDFLKRKCKLSADHGFEVSLDEIHEYAKPHVKLCVQWALRGGQRALFANFGLHKTVMQLEIARLISQRTGGGFLIVAPLGVRQEFKRDAEKLGIEIQFVRRNEDVHSGTGNSDKAATDQCFTGRGLSGSPTRDGIAQRDEQPARGLRGDHGGIGRVLGTGEDQSSETRTGRAEAAPGSAALGISSDCRNVSAITDRPRPVIYLTNYESVRDGKLSPSLFTAASLDEAAVLRGFGGTKTFREFMRLFDGMQYKFVATATPDPNEYIELLAYAAFLEIMDVGQAKTRFFKRDSTKADKLTIHPHKEKEFWLWVASWALFLQKPSDLGCDDTGYDLPPMEIIHHEVAVDHASVKPDKHGRGRLFREATGGVTDAAREKRETLDVRVVETKRILDAEPTEHFLLWHDLEAEREAIEDAVPAAVSVYGNQDIAEREQAIIDFAEGRIQHLAAKAVMFGAGCNFQRHCHNAIFVGIGFKFADWIQAIHRIYRFLQSKPVRIHLIYAESERNVLRTLMEKWEQHKDKMRLMGDIIREYGLSKAAMATALTRSMGVERVEFEIGGARLVNNDSVEELPRHADNSAHLILTSIPFSTQYEYTPSYNDFGHSEDNDAFFEQMDFLTPELLRVLQPGRVAAIHVKDRIVPGGMTGLGFQTVYPFHCEVIEHYTKHGFAYMGMKTVVTDVVRENNQTYRLGWTEQCKDGTKMGVGMPEYLLLFRKPPSDHTNSYADLPVVKEKSRYSRSRWQIDAHGFSRSSGNRLLSSDELKELDHQAIFKRFRQHSMERVYDFEEHVQLGEELETCTDCRHIHVMQGGTCACGCKGQGRLPVTFMLLQPQSWHEDVWTDITRMLTLNGAQSAKGKEMHLCPMQFDLADRAIAQLSMPGETVLDPFGGLMTVPYRAVLAGRKAIGIELAPRYFLDGCAYLKAAEQKLATPTLFDFTTPFNAEAAEAGEHG